MDIQTLTTFFMWCAIINGSLLILWTTMFILAPVWCTVRKVDGFPFPEKPTTWSYTRSSGCSKSSLLSSMSFLTWLC